MNKGNREFDLRELSVMLGISPDIDLKNIKVIIKNANSDEIIAEKDFNDFYEALYKLPINLDEVENGNQEKY